MAENQNSSITIEMQYLSNTFSKIKFRDAEKNELVTVQAKNDKGEPEYFDTLTIEGDDWITFSPSSNSDADVKFEHRKLHGEGPNVNGLQFDAAGHYISGTVSGATIQVSVDENGNMTFSI